MLYSLFLGSYGVFNLKITLINHFWGFFMIFNKICIIFTPLNNDVIITQQWRNCDVIMTSLTQKLYIIEFLFLKEVFWPSFKTISRFCVELLQFQFYKGLTRKSRFWVMSPWSWASNFSLGVPTNLKFGQSVSY